MGVERVVSQQEEQHKQRLLVGKLGLLGRVRRDWRGGGQREVVSMRLRRTE